ncbi:MAG: transglutaminase-like domain-containing protein [Isosphaeraceae bacterium]|nr:transglutaminase-like domain-containing protein [Isosphaeraceae bacterium]
MTGRPLRTVLFTAACALASVHGLARADPPAPAYVMETTAAKRVKATLIVDVKAPKVRADEWTVYAAQAPNLPGQTDVRMSLPPRGKVARELSNEGRPMLYERLPAASAQSRQNLSARLEYEVTLLTRRLQKRGPGAPDVPRIAPLDAKTRRSELAAAYQFDHDAEPFQTWLDEQKLRRGSDEDDVDFARRAFAVLRKSLSHYEGADAAHEASKVCAAGKSDYAGLTAAYVAVLRANGIPARALCGFPVIFEGQPNKNYWPHAKAEFYAQGVGWVSADLAGAVRSNSPDEGLDFFGNDRADFLTAHTDTHLIIDTYFGRKTLDWLPDISWWVKGAGSFDGTRTTYTLSVQVEPLDLAEALAAKPSRPGAAKAAKKPAR